MMTALKLILDCETLPTGNPGAIIRIAQSLKPPGSMKKPETIAAWIENERPAALAKALADTAFDGTYGRLACIGWAVDDEEPNAYLSRYAEDDTEDEEDLLACFFKDVEISRKSGQRVVVVGHNIANFDIPFITKRAVVNGVRIPSWWPWRAKPWDDAIFDTMTAWAGARDHIGLDRLCAALGLPGKTGVDGSMVAGMWEAGKYADVGSYCADDVERVRRVAKRLWASLGEPAS